MISVIVSTRNRARKLHALLESLVCCNATGEDWEAVVADNDSTDDTAEVARAFAERFPGRFSYVYQSTSGKATGINLAIRQARGDLIALVDDDVRVAQNWLGEMAASYQADSELGGVGGRIELFDPGAAPVAIRRSPDAAIISDYPFNPSNIPVLGCNLSFRREIIADVGSYDERFGPGSVIGSGDDAEIIYRIQRSGYKLAYSPDILVYHDHGRQIGEDTQKTARRYTRGRGALYCKYIAIGDRHMLKCLYYEVRRCFVSIAAALVRGRLDKEALDALRALVAGAFAYAKAPREMHVRPDEVRSCPPPPDSE
jgi:hypothetical protein